MNKLDLILWSQQNTTQPDFATILPDLLYEMFVYNGGLNCNDVTWASERLNHQYLDCLFISSFRLTTENQSCTGKRRTSRKGLICGNRLHAMTFSRVSKNVLYFFKLHFSAFCN